MIVWLCIVICIMVELDIFKNSDFVSFGPRKELSFMKVPIDTYYKYNILIIMIVLHTFITDFIADSLSPHVLNIVQDPKTKYIPHKPYIYFGVTTVWALYCSITQLFVIFIAFAQLDLLIVRLVSDICANFVTTTLYLHGKEYNPTKYKIIEMKQLQNENNRVQFSENFDTISENHFNSTDEAVIHENLNIIWETDNHYKNVEKTNTSSIYKIFPKYPVKALPQKEISSSTSPTDSDTLLDYKI